MASGSTSSGKPAVRARRAGYPELTPAFTWTALALAVWVRAGSIVDINAHNHGIVDESFFTPFHLLMYSGVAANGLFYVLVQFRNVGRGHSLLRALPREYLLSFVGVLLFGLGGVFDFIWHALFGVETSIDALVSPSHLLLFFSAVLFMSGPLRSFLAGDRSGRGWAALFPALVSALLVLTTGTLITLFANVWTQIDRYVALTGDDNVFSAEAITVSGVLIPVVLMTATLLYLRQRMLLPFGAVTVLVAANALIMLYIRWQWTREHAVVLLAALIAGLAGDWLLTRSSGSSPLVMLRRFAFLLPFLLIFSLFVILQFSATIWWNTHLWLGVSLLAGALGLVLGALLTQGEIPAAD
ncbi:MAG: hypothetical protein J4G17_01480 [Anaerolineae bacterium]|nr:hypothetical protein [Anaerolineae bacterium]